MGPEPKPSIVPAEDKAAYGAIFDELMAAAKGARDTVTAPGALRLKPMNFSPVYGSRAHRPIDLWVSLCGVGAEAFGHFPQVYAIASERGLEVGFAATINEADYHDVKSKTRNRLIVPLLNAKLPGPTEPLTLSLDTALGAQDGWQFNTKTRLAHGDPGWEQYGSLAELLAALKRAGPETGGGTICRTFSTTELASVDLQAEFEAALRLFLPLIRRCTPTHWDAEIASDLDKVAALSDQVEDQAFNPAGLSDARDIVLAAVARRQGQAKFRKTLFKAYDGRCAVTGTAVPSVLQAAHITPYLGAQTNHVTNGLLLRADIHTLFDLRLLKIEPNTLQVWVSEALQGTPYADLHGQAIAATTKRSQSPSHAALRHHFDAPSRAAALANASEADQTIAMED